MASTRPIQRLGLDAGIVERLKGISINTLKDLLTTSPLVLMLSLDISLYEAELIQKQASAKVACDRNHTALELLQTRAQQRIYLPTGIQKLDSIMLGGLNMGTITEITGPPGVGKTQFCIGCCVEAIARSHPFYGTNQRNSVIYIDTEHKFDCMRLAEVAAQRYPGLYGQEQDEVEIGALLDHVKIMRPSTCKELYEMISTLQPTVISEHVSLIVVDSMAALARRESLNEHDKEQFVVNQASLLKMMAELCHCTVICTNQIMVENVSNQSRPTTHASVFVTATLLPKQQAHNRPSTTTTMHMTGSSSSVIPCIEDSLIAANGGTGEAYRAALGTTWHHCISTRLTMHKIAAAALHTTTTSHTQHQQQYSSSGSGSGSGGSGSGVGLGMGASPHSNSASSGGMDVVMSQEIGVLRLTKSPVAGYTQIYFDIGMEGIRALN